jgi:hypothetical protein
MALQWRLSRPLTIEQTNASIHLQGLFGAGKHFPGVSGGDGKTKARDRRAEAGTEPDG